MACPRNSFSAFLTLMCFYLATRKHLWYRVVWRVLVNSGIKRVLLQIYSWVFACKVKLQTIVTAFWTRCCKSDLVRTRFVVFRQRSGFVEHWFGNVRIRRHPISWRLKVTWAWRKRWLVDEEFPLPFQIFDCLVQGQKLFHQWKVKVHQRGLKQTKLNCLTIKYNGLFSWAWHNFDIIDSKR